MLVLSPVRSGLPLLAGVVTLLVGAGLPGTSAPPDTSAAVAATATPVVLLSELDGTEVPAQFVLEVDIAGATAAKVVVDGSFLGKSTERPPRLPLNLAPGEHDVRVRVMVEGSAEEVRVDAVVAVGRAPATAEVADEDEDAGSGPVSLPVPNAAGEIEVDTGAEIQAALAGAQPGDVIRVVDGEYQFDDDRLTASASGTADAPITLRGTRAAQLRTKNASGDYGLHITGDYWRIEGLTVAHATKGIVLDGSLGTVITDVEVYDVGDEAVHFRSCSSDGVLRNSYIHDTGRNSPQYGEGVYVGSANSNWDEYTCADPVENVDEGDNTERVLIENNRFEDITAEGADLKEGTDSGTLRNNEFRRVGLSGENSADSAVDAKGNNWLIEGNLVAETDATWDDEGTAQPSVFADGFQSHEVYDGYGTGNRFVANTVEGQIPGFGVGLYPALDNVVTCDNVADGAALGLVGDGSQPADCTA